MQRVRQLLADKEFKTHLEKISSRENQRHFCKHDLAHFMDVARICYQLWLEAGCPQRALIDKEIIYAAALLHDIGRWQEYDGVGDHALISARLADTILKRMAFSPVRVELMTKAIAGHRKLQGGEGILGELLYRADKLSRHCFLCEAQTDCYKYSSLKHQDIY